MSILLIEFEGFPQEKALIGEMLSGYGEIEFALITLLTVFFRSSPSDAMRVLFRVRGGSARIEVTDAILRKPLQDIGLGGQWGNALGAVRCCKDIRNQYAHCHWVRPEDAEYPLTFLNLDFEAEKQSPNNMQLEPVDLELLQEQRRYFEYSVSLLYFVQAEYHKRAGLSSSHGIPIPKSIPAPPKSNLKKLRTALLQAADTTKPGHL